MERVQIADNLQFSRIIHGQWRLIDWGYNDQQVLELLEQCLELGITTIDTADIYGNYKCETAFGKALALKPEVREKIEIVTKCGIKLSSRDDVQLNHYDSSKQHILHSVDTSLQNMGTDYIDVLLIHRPDVLTNPEEVAEAFISLQSQGKVKHFGVSNYLPSQVRMLQAHLPMPLVTNQVELSVLARDQFENGTIDQAIERKMPPMAWSPLAGGTIFNSKDENIIRVRIVLEKIAAEIGARNIDQVMYAWLLKHPASIMPIVGSGKIDRVKSAVDALQLKMTREQWYEIWVASRGKQVD